MTACPKHHVHLSSEIHTPASEVYTSCVVTSMTSRTADNEYSSDITYMGCDDTASGTPKLLMGPSRCRNFKRRRITGENGEPMESENDGCCLDNYENSFIMRNRKKRKKKRVNISITCFFMFYESHSANKILEKNKFFFQSSFFQKIKFLILVILEK